MPVFLTSYLLPKNGGKWFVLEDTYLRGGYRVCATTAAMTGIHTSSRKSGMLVYVQSNGRTYRLETDLVTWTPQPLPGTGNESSSVTTHLHQQPTESSNWTVVHNKATMFFNAAVYDSDGNQILPSNVKAINANSLLLQFSIPVSGYSVIVFHQQ